MLEERAAGSDLLRAAKQPRVVAGGAFVEDPPTSSAAVGG